MFCRFDDSSASGGEIHDYENSQSFSEASCASISSVRGRQARGLPAGKEGLTAPGLFRPMSPYVVDPDLATAAAQVNAPGQSAAPMSAPAPAPALAPAVVGHSGGTLTPPGSGGITPGIVNTNPEFYIPDDPALLDAYIIIGGIRSDVTDEFAVTNPGGVSVPLNGPWGVNQTYQNVSVAHTDIADAPGGVQTTQVNVNVTSSQTVTGQTRPG